MGETKTLLVIGEMPDLAEQLSQALRPGGWQVDGPLVGDDAAAAAREERYELIVADGAHWMERVPGKPMLVVERSSSPEHVLTCIRAGAFSYFSEPFDVRVVADMILRAAAEPGWTDDLKLVSGTPEWVEIHARCKTQAVERLVQYMREMLRDLEPADGDALSTAVREILLNGMEHGAGSDESQRLQLACVRTRRAIEFYIRDPGEGFSWDALPHAAVSNPPDSPTSHIDYRSEHGLRPGGFGILLARNLVDELVYNEKGNEVRIIKYLDPDQ